MKRSLVMFVLLSILGVSITQDSIRKSNESNKQSEQPKPQQPKENFYISEYSLEISKQFLSIFNEIENRLGQVQEFAKKGNEYLAKSQVNDHTQKLQKEIAVKLQNVTGGIGDNIEEKIVSNVFGFVTAGIIAASTYAYMV